MIFILARDGADAREWAGFNGVGTKDYVLVTPWTLHGRHLFPQDRIVRTARFPEREDAAKIEATLAFSLVLSQLVETVHGRLVPAYKVEAGV